MTDEGGYTLVELLVVMAVSLAMLLATLVTFDVFGSQTASNTRLTTAEDTDRRQVDAITRALRGARPRSGTTDAVLVPATGSGRVNDLAVTTYAGAASSDVLRVVRFCVNTTTRTLWREALADAGAYVAPGAACPSAAAGWARAAVVRQVANTTADPLFAVDAARRAIDINLRLDGRDAARPLALRSSAYLRLPTLSSTAAAPVGVTTSCNGITATMRVTGSGASASFTTKLTNGLPITLGVGTSVSFPAAVSTLVTPVITNASGAVQTLSAVTVVCP